MYIPKINLATDQEEIIAFMKSDSVLQLLLHLRIIFQLPHIYLL
jgi:hypothetical protein